jgi:DNA polymerase-3 subunit delta'
MFDNLAGNQNVKELLKRMLESGRVPGALLFTGEEGVGKKLFAVELAKALNCRTPKGIEACDECSSCRRIGRFNFPQSDKADDWEQLIRTDHADVAMVLAPKRVLKVDQMRAIEREANYRPFEGKARVFLIDDADKLNDPSANALLKTLEEPPPTSHLILITARPGMLLATIRSRCQSIRFSPLAVSEIEEYLGRDKTAKPKEVRLRARLASGSIGRALQTDLNDYESRRAVMVRVLEALTVTRDRQQLLTVSEELNSAKYKDDYEAMLDILEALIRDAWKLKLQTGETVNEDITSQLAKIAERLSSADAGRWIDEIEMLREQLIVNINRKVATDALFLSMADGRPVGIQFETLRVPVRRI